MTAFGESTLAAARKQATKLKADLRAAMEATSPVARWAALVAASNRLQVIESNLDQVAELEKSA